MIDATFIQLIADTAIHAVVAAWRLQGHELTGTAARTIDYEARKKANGINIDFYIQDYMNAIDKGVPASRIPFSPGSGARHSKYIAGLTRYAKLRMGANQREAESIAFKIAHNALRSGMPSPGSRKYSKTGKRTGFIDEGLKTEEVKISQMIEKAITLMFAQTIESFFESSQRIAA